MLPLLHYPFLMVVLAIVSLWTFNLYRRRVLGVWSNFQPLLTALMILLLVVCMPSVWHFFVHIDDLTPGPPPGDGQLLAIATVYLVGFALLIQIPMYLRGFVRSRLLRPRPRRRTRPGYPFDGEESER